jgi:hypothetical protein
MKFLKTKNISKFSINDRSLIAYPDGNGPGNRVVVNAKGGMMLPKGSTAQRPQLSSVRQPTDANGTIRYNTSNSTIEAYVRHEGSLVTHYRETPYAVDMNIPLKGKKIFVRKKRMKKVEKEYIGLLDNPNYHFIQRRDILGYEP